MYAPYYRSHINTIVFLKKVLETCTNKPVVLVDGGPWYPWPLNEMGFKWLHVTFGYRNAIERFFRTLKERTRRFYNNLPSTRMDNHQSFKDVFMLWYNHLRRHQDARKNPSGGDAILTVSSHTRPTNKRRHPVLPRHDSRKTQEDGRTRRDARRKEGARERRGDGLPGPGVDNPRLGRLRREHVGELSEKLTTIAGKQADEFREAGGRDRPRPQGGRPPRAHLGPRRKRRGVQEPCA